MHSNGLTLKLNCSKQEQTQNSIFSLLMNIKENSCIIIHTYHGLNKGYRHMLNTRSNFTGAVFDDIKFEQDELPSEDDQVQYYVSNGA